MTADRGEKGELAREHRTYSRESIWNLQQGVSTGLIQEWFWCFGFIERIVCFNVSASRSPPGHNKISGCIFCMHYIQRGISTVAQSFPPARQYSWVHFSQTYVLAFEACVMGVLCVQGGTLPYFLESFFLVLSSAQRSPDGRSTQQGGNVYGLFWEMLCHS